MKGQSKYFNIKTRVTTAGKSQTFDSRGESKRFIFLRQREKTGEITDLRTQVKFPFKSPSDGLVCTYIADFVYIRNGKMIVEDYKSKATITSLFKTKKLLMLLLYNIEVQVVLEAGKW